MQNFQQILTQAAQLKECQLKKERKQYEGLPEFIKSGLNYDKKYDQVRKQHFLYQLRISTKLRKEGNQHFKLAEYEQAENKYEQSLSIFRYIKAKKYENIKDQDIEYRLYDISHLTANELSKYNENLNSIYMNISNCLSKLNRKDEALMSADEALKVKNSVKGHYRKAQAYLQHINRDQNDFKLGLLQLRQAYNIGKDQFILQQMHKAKKSFDQEQKKEKQWFKFMFQKNKGELELTNKTDHSQQKNKQVTQTSQRNQIESIQRKNQQKMKQVLLQNQSQFQKQEKIQRTKQKLQTYITMSDDQWLLHYQADYLKKNSNKIYSLMNIYGYADYAAEYRALLAQCLSNTQQKLSQSFEKWMEWLRMHPIDQIVKYIERYDSQVKWIQQQRKQQKDKRISQKLIQARADEETIYKQEKPKENTNEETKMPSWLISLLLTLIVLIFGILFRQAM